MIYVTGDTHANIDIGKLNTKRFPPATGFDKERLFSNMWRLWTCLGWVFQRNVLARLAIK